MKKKIVAGNWKMNTDYTSGLSLFSEIIHMLNDEYRNEAEVVVCAPFIHLHSLVQLAKSSAVSIGAQNCHDKAEGAFTGEISARMIASAGGSHVIIGHSERRQYFGESDELLAAKTRIALDNGLKVIFCIGETLEQRNSNSHFEVIRAQLSKGLEGIEEKDLGALVLAYEPVWAIGTGLTATPEQAQEVHAFIRNEIASVYGSEAAEKLRILYGGSCNAQNAGSLFSQNDIDGGLIGGASLKSRDFVEIIKQANT